MIARHAYRLAAGGALLALGVLAVYLVREIGSSPFADLLPALALAALAVSALGLAAMLRIAAVRVQVETTLLAKVAAKVEAAAGRLPAAADVDHLIQEAGALRRQLRHEAAERAGAATETEAGEPRRP
jgi:hypothetical protein